MGIDFYLECENNSDLIKDLEAANLSYNWRGFGHYYVLEALTWLDLYPNGKIDRDTIIQMSKCVEYYLVHGTQCPDDMMPNYDNYPINEVPEYCISKQRPAIDGITNFKGIATKLDIWLKIGIKHNCVIKFW